MTRISCTTCTSTPITAVYISVPISKSCCLLQYRSGSFVHREAALCLNTTWKAVFVLALVSFCPPARFWNHCVAREGEGSRTNDCWSICFLNSTQCGSESSETLGSYTFPSKKCRCECGLSDVWQVIHNRNKWWWWLQWLVHFIITGFLIRDSWWIGMQWQVLLFCNVGLDLAGW